MSEYWCLIGKQSWHLRVLGCITLPLNHPLYLTIVSLCLDLYVCISPSYTKFSSPSTDWNIVLKDILQTRHIWTYKREAMLTILHYQPLAYLQHPEAIYHGEDMCGHLADIPHTEIDYSPRWIINSVWPLSTHPSLLEFCRFPMLHQFYAMRSCQMLEHSGIITSYREAIFKCRCFHFCS